MTDHPPPRRRCRGFTVIELLIAMAIAGVLASVAYPTFRGAVDRSRRADAIGALLLAQLAQERWRANQLAYGTLAEIGVPATSAPGTTRSRPARPPRPATSCGPGHRRPAAGCGVPASAPCVAGAQVAYASGPDATVANPTDLNRRCWSL